MRKRSLLACLAKHGLLDRVREGARVTGEVREELDSQKAELDRPEVLEDVLVLAGEHVVVGQLGPAEHERAEGALAR